MATQSARLGPSIREHLECPICFGFFRQPKMLDCMHSFCLKCLQELSQEQDARSKKLTCPVCRHETALKENGVASLSSNFTLSALVEAAALEEQLPGGQGSVVKCQACDEDNRAISRCEDCGYYLCQECQRAHERLAMMRSHKIYTLAQLKSQVLVQVTKSSGGIAHQCGEHLDQNACLYCSTCEQLVCTNCSLRDHDTDEHHLSGIAEASEKCRQHVADLFAKAAQGAKRLSLAIVEMEMSRKKLDAMFAGVTQKVSARASGEVARIRDEERKMKQEVLKIYKDRAKIFETAQATSGQELAEAQHKLDEAKGLLAQESQCEILEFKQKLLHNLNELAHKQPETVPDSLVFMDFENGQECPLGRLVLCDRDSESDGTETLNSRRKWELKTESVNCEPDQVEFGFAYDVAAFSDNEIAVADIEKSQITFLPSQEGDDELSHSSLPRQELTALYHPSHVSVNREDSLVVLDGLAVKVFNRKDYELLHEFMPGRGSNSTPTCLAVDDNDLIAVGYEDKEVICLHSLDGTLIRTLPAPMIGDYLTTYKQRFIYINHGRKKLIAVDYDGIRVFSEDVDIHKQDKNLGPTSECCDKEGLIYVAVLKPWSGEIHCFGPDGKYKGCAIDACGPTLGLTFTPQGELALAAEQAVQIYHPV
ncbi:E3 ubiquitin-protein ligase TRIM56-like [Patiria miniata]|uniref:E3 ubiquitin-protein ligase TRIM56 n=1 Tax=Patiria miniata TaxID=46514 RepID=A0A913ZGX2_PATMI|nr:E3 ubiquitin-protein ligase TRIM56-like [Patiria miniata]